MEKAWFELDKHGEKRICTCSCGTRFKSQAREIGAVVTRTVKDRDGDPVLKHGVEQTEKVSTNGVLSKHGCPKCGTHWIKEFE